MRQFTAIENLESRRLMTAGTSKFIAPGVVTTAHVTRAGEKFILPTVTQQGDAFIVGTSSADVITVDRIRDLSAVVNDGACNFVTYFGQDGGVVSGTGLIEQYADGTFLADERAERDSYLAEAATARANGDTGTAEAEEKQAAENQGRIDFGEFFLKKFTDGKFIRYSVAGAYDYFVEMSDEQAADAKLTIDAGAGKDMVKIGADVPMKASVNGGSGSDTIESGKHRARLFGGNGNDKLISRSTNGGSLDGGSGADRYYNKASASINIAARADGDRVSTNKGLVMVKTPGVFGTSTIASSTSTTKKDAYYLIDDGQTNLLA